jgi:hypothetical protein
MSSGIRIAAQGLMQSGKNPSYNSKPDEAKLALVGFIVYPDVDGHIIFAQPSEKYIGQWVARINDNGKGVTSRNRKSLGLVCTVPVPPEAGEVIRITQDNFFNQRRGEVGRMVDGVFEARKIKHHKKRK